MVKIITHNGIYLNHVFLADDRNKFYDNRYRITKIVITERYDRWTYARINIKPYLEKTSYLYIKQEYRVPRIIVAYINSTYKCPNRKEDAAATARVLV